ncbi:hypothetical protein [Capsulimonas corticalis]|uniref:hypothetical protein n=1 Tax=Capsulimonas corticalis TaxID=2219043 RepID=UPI000F64701C|nr:hypothetical protein [Capsulimonas corticalis]
MPRSWSNQRKGISQAVEADRKPGVSVGLASLLLLLWLVFLAFAGIIGYGFISTTQHPLAEQPQAAADRPRED